MDIFLFSYYARGMNFNDIAKLKWSDLINDNSNKKQRLGRGLGSLLGQAQQQAQQPQHPVQDGAE